MTTLPDIPISNKSIYSIDLMTEYNPFFRVFISKKPTNEDPYYAEIPYALTQRITDIEIQLTDRKAPLIEITIDIESMFISKQLFAGIYGYETFTIGETADLVSSIDGITTFFDLGSKIKIDFGYTKFHTSIENYDVTDFKIQLKNGGVIATIIAQKLGSRKNITYPAIVYTSGTIIDVLRDLLYRTGIKLENNFEDNVKQRLQQLDDDILSAELELQVSNTELEDITKKQEDSYKLYKGTPPERHIAYYKKKIDAIQKSILDTTNKIKSLKEQNIGLLDSDLKLIEFNQDEPFVVAPNTISKAIQDILLTLDASLDVSDIQNKIKSGIAVKRNTDITLSYGKPNSEIKSITFKTEDLQEKARYSGVPQIQRNTFIPNIASSNDTTTPKTTPFKSNISSGGTTSLATPTGSTRNTKSQFERAKINKNARNVLTASVEMLTGYPAFYPLDKIYLDLGNSFYSGVYVIDHVIHEFSDMGFKTKMELNKEANKKQIPKKKQNTL